MTALKFRERAKQDTAQKAETEEKRWWFGLRSLSPSKMTTRSEIQRRPFFVSEALLFCGLQRKQAAPLLREGVALLTCLVLNR